MISNIVMFVGIMIALLVPPVRAEPVEAQDDTGRTVTLSRPAQRIVSLAPHVTELLFAAGAGGRVVGAVDYSDFPQDARRIARVGSAAALDLERIVALRPELVVGWKSGNPAVPVERLAALGLPLFLSEPRRLDDIATNIERLGVLAGTADSARAAGDAFRAGIAALRARYARARPVPVFYQIWNQPLQTVNGAHMISAVLELCGGRNIFAALGPLAPQVGIEDVLAADPEVILVSDSDTTHDGPRQWARWPSLRAVRARHVFNVPPDHIQRQTPRILLGAQRVCEVLEQVRQEH